MAQASLKPVALPDVAAPAESAPARDLPAIAVEGVEAAESPARALQARLEAEIALEPKMPARAVIALVVSVCVATWFAGFLLYASL